VTKGGSCISRVETREKAYFSFGDAEDRARVTLQLQPESKWSRWACACTALNAGWTFHSLADHSCSNKEQSIYAIENRDTRGALDARDRSSRLY